MKRINYFLVTFIAILSIIMSCKKQDILLTTEGIIGTTITIGADVSSHATHASKSAIDGTNFAWKTGDTLGVYVDNNSTTPTKFTLDESDDGQSKGSFTGSLTAPSDKHIYAVYPHDGSKEFTTSSNISYTFDLADIQVQKHVDGVINPESLGRYAYMYGKSTSTISEANRLIPMSMFQIMTVIDFKISGIDANTKIHSLTLKSNEAMFATTATVNLDNGSVTSTPTITGEEVTVFLKNNNKSGVLPTSNELTIRLAMFPQTIVANKQWIVELGTSASDKDTTTHSRSYTKPLSGSVKAYESGHRYMAEIGYDEFGNEQPAGDKLDNPYHELVAVFPGQVAESVPRVNNHKVTITPDFTQWGALKIAYAPSPWLSTGLYAAPADIVTINVPEGIVGTVSCRLGVWTCNKSGVRPIPIWKTIELEVGANKVFNYFGGNIYLLFETPSKTPYTFTFSNVIETTDFVVGETDPTQWKEKIKETKVPWAEIRGKHMILTLPVAKLRNIGDPIALMAWYNEFLTEDYNKLWGLSEGNPDVKHRSPDAPWRMTTDNNICAGAAHAGYPFIASNSWGDRATNLNHMMKSDWGIYHELGHNYQTYTWKPSYFVEVTCNLHVYHMHNRKYNDWPSKDKFANFNWAVDNWVSDAADNATDGRHFSQLYSSSGPHGQRLIEMITPFLQLAQEYGWKYLTYVNSASREYVSPRAMYDADRMDFFMKRVTEYAGVNLMPFFDAWGMRASTKFVRQYIEQFDEYIGEPFWTKYDQNKMPSITSERVPVVKQSVPEPYTYDFAFSDFATFSEDDQKKFYTVGGNPTNIDFNMTYLSVKFLQLNYAITTPAYSRYFEFGLSENKNNVRQPLVLKPGRYIFKLAVRGWKSGTCDIYFNGKKLRQFNLESVANNVGQLFDMGEVIISEDDIIDPRVKIQYVRGGDGRIVLHSLQLREIWEEDTSTVSGNDFWEGSSW